MKSVFLLIYILIMHGFSLVLGQNASIISGEVKSYSAQVLKKEPGVQISLIHADTTITLLSDSSGIVHFSNLSAGNYTIIFSKNGFESQQLSCLLGDSEHKKVQVLLIPEETKRELLEVVVKADRPTSAASSSYLNALDFENRPKNSAQDMLRLVPGLFIAQHAGGGKAEQLFIRGFDCDHGTDVASFVDGVPVNMPSHGHGQGYEDLHFLIPETVKGMDVFKGPYHAQFGNFATAAAVQFNTVDTLSKQLILLENTIIPSLKSATANRLVGMFQVPTFSKRISSYVATEWIQNRSYFEKNQHFKRFNLFSKTIFTIDKSSKIILSISGFGSSWDASGQVPDRAVNSGLISRFGSIDPTEGGTTSRGNINVIYESKKKNKLFFTQLYLTNYRFNLFSNFTFFLNDSIQGDQIEQGDKRGVIGMNTKYTFIRQLGKIDNRLTVGASFRCDEIQNDLWHTMQRNRLNPRASAEINEFSNAFYVNEALQIQKKLRLEIGARYDYMIFQVNDLLPGDSSRKNYSGSNYQGLLSPKINLIYTARDRVQFFVNFGKGFHSNDARSSVQESTKHQLPKSVGGELGTLFRFGKKGVISAAFWTLNLENELVYVGDEGTTENKGSSRRTGIDLSLRWQLTPYLFADVDYNHSKNQFTSSFFGAILPTGSSIPLAPVTTSSGGLTYSYQKIKASLRYRYMSDRPANETNSVVARGYNVIDFMLNYKTNRFKLGFTIENVLNVNWNEAQFETESKLKTESQSVSELHYTPGTPFAAKLSFGYLF